MSAVDLTESRYDRQSRIAWWNQDVLAGARVLVVGAGALGNEIVKNLALIGVGRVTVVDLDTVELSNLARCVLLRESDTGASKAERVADRAAELNPDVEIAGLHSDVRSFGLGDLDGFDLVIGGLDNREARAWVNEACRKLGMTWVDGAIEGLRGIARVFPPEGACYECTLGEVDRKILAHRRSCALLSSEEMLSGKVPTTATTSSVIAALQVQEAVKLLHGRDDLLALAGRAFVFYGETLETYLIDYAADPTCLAHDTYGALVEHTVVSTTSLRDLLGAVPDSGVVAIDFEEELAVAGVCDPCDERRELRTLLSRLAPEQVRCPTCGETFRLELRQSIEPDDEVADIPVLDTGLGDGHVVTLRSADARIHLSIRTAAGAA